MASNNPTFELGFLDDFEDLENVSKMVAKSSEALKAKVLPVKTTASQIYPSGIWRKYLKINNQHKTKKYTNCCVSTFKSAFPT